MKSDYDILSSYSAMATKGDQCLLIASAYIIMRVQSCMLEHK